MQNAKDTFYETLRGRLASLNPERTVVVRGVTRPGVLVDENETQSIAPLADCFHLRWLESAVAREGELPLATLACEIGYATAGSAWNGGLDRGRALSAMDLEMLGAVGAAPQNALKYNYSGLAAGGAPAAMTSRIWWSDPVLEPVRVSADRLERVARIQVMSFEEGSELTW